MVWLNMAGPLRVFLNKSTSNFITVAVPDTIAYLGASVAVETDGPRLFWSGKRREGFTLRQEPSTEV